MPRKKEITTDKKLHPSKRAKDVAEKRASIKKKKRK